MFDYVITNKGYVKANATFLGGVKRQICFVWSPIVLVGFFCLFVFLWERSFWDQEITNVLAHVKGFSLTNNCINGHF